MKVLILIAMATVAMALPQNWPYRDNMEYYGYQNRPGFYRSQSGSSEDDEVESAKVVVNKGRQDLKVGGGQSPVVATSGITTPVVVVETGSAKPVVSEINKPNIKQATQPGTADVVKQQQQPAFPPATPPSPPPPPTDSSEEEDEDEDEDQDDDNSDEEERRRNLNVNETNNATTVNATNVQTVEALVPGYITEQGEVLVPFDTVVKEGDGGVVAVVEDPQYEAPVVVLPSDNEIPRVVPKFFNANGERQLYYAEVPPPGAIFTFDDDNDVGGVGIGRQGETSSEEAQDDNSESTQDDDDTSASDEATSPSRPPLSFIKATAPSGEDDEAESLGIRIARMSEYDPRFNNFYGSRSPNFFYHHNNGNGYYVTRYPESNNRRNYGYHGDYGNYNRNYGNYEPEPIYYYRPASNEKVKVVPLGSFDVSLEEFDSGEVRPVVGPFQYSQRRPVTLRRRTPQTNRRPVIPSANRIIIQKPVLAVYGGTPVTRQRNKQRREAKEMNKKKKKEKKERIMRGDKKKVTKKMN